MFELSYFSAKRKYYDNWIKLVVGKMKDKTSGLAFKEFGGLNPNICSFLVDDSSEHKKAKGVHINFDTTTSHNE